MELCPPLHLDVGAIRVILDEGHQFCLHKTMIIKNTDWLHNGIRLAYLKTTTNQSQTSKYHREYAYCIFCSGGSLTIKEWSKCGSLAYMKIHPFIAITSMFTLTLYLLRFNRGFKSSSSSSSSCLAASTDIPDPLSPLLPIVHRLWQVFRTTSRILT